MSPGQRAPCLSVMCSPAWPGRELLIGSAGKACVRPGPTGAAAVELPGIAGALLIVLDQHARLRQPCIVLTRPGRIGSQVRLSRRGLCVDIYRSIPRVVQSYFHATPLDYPPEASTSMNVSSSVPSGPVVAFCTTQWPSSVPMWTVLQGVASGGPTLSTAASVSRVVKM